MTCHFIDKEWTLRSAVLETSHFPGSHTAGNIATKVRQSLSGLGVREEQVVSFVHDETANVVAACRKLREDVGWTSQMYGAHLLQTAIRRAIDRNCTLQRILRCGHRLMARFCYSNLKTEALLQKQHQMGMQPLLIENVTMRWNSSYYMPQHLLKLRLPLMAVLTGSSQKKDVRKLLLSETEWKLAENIVEILQPLNPLLPF